MPETANRYFQTAIDTIEQVMESEKEALDQAAQWIANSMVDDGVLHIFGAGHSMLMGQELMFRAGGLSPVNAILDINFSLMGPPPSAGTSSVPAKCWLSSRSRVAIRSPLRPPWKARNEG
jgi:uncharacterized phosphosugar-binding protein